MTRIWLEDTESVCPVCLQKLVARKVQEGDCIYMEKTCPAHGDFSALLWRGEPPYESWRNEKLPSTPEKCAVEVKYGCPYDCGLCAAHRQHPCCVLLELTQRCNLGCPVCFASAGKPLTPDPSMETIGRWMDALLEAGGPFNLQLSGGEPTLRDDLPQIIQMGREKGFTFFQLNTNGLRLAAEAGYAQALKEAGLSCAFLQFDSMEDGAYKVLRGRPLLEQKLAAIDACRKAGLGVVLVPVIAAGVNDGQVGPILRFALEQMPAVRGVHFQPMSFFGRCEAEGAGRFTLPDLLRAIESQTEGLMKIGDFTPGGAENAYCSFSGNFMQNEDGTLRAWHAENACGCGSTKPVAAQAAAKARKFVAKRWSARPAKAKAPGTSNSCCCTSSLDSFLERVDQYTLAVSAMGFMDAGNFDLERLKDCYIHVVSESEGVVRLIPFCAYNLTATDGTTLYRGHEKP